MHCIYKLWLVGTSVSFEIHLKTHGEVYKSKCDIIIFMKWRLEWPHYADLRNQVKTVVPWSKLGVASCSQKKYEHVYLGMYIVPQEVRVLSFWWEFMICQRHKLLKIGEKILGFSTFPWWPPIEACYCGCLAYDQVSVDGTNGWTEMTILTVVIS